MKQTIRLVAVPALFAALAMMAGFPAHAQSDGAGVSIHSKTKPSDPPSAKPESDPAETAPEAGTSPQDDAADAGADTAQEETAQEENAAQSGEDPASETAAEGETQPAGSETAGSQPSNPLGANSDSGWDVQFGTAPPQTSQFTAAPEQTAIVEKINAYFNDMTNLEGDFLQTDADNKSRKGKFFLERPGKVLFDYSLPSKQKIISNGKYLAIEDHDLNTTDRYPLDATPFRLLLKERVNLAEDAHIAALDVGKDIVVLTVEDKEARGGGQIRLFFDWPEIQLREWIITDAQGLNTRIELASLESNKEVDPKLFTFSKEVGLPKFRGGEN